VKKGLFLLAALGVALLGLELAVRASGYSAVFWYRPDARLGWTLRPGARGWFIKEGRTFVRISDAGFRDRDHSLYKPDDVYRMPRRCRWNCRTPGGRCSAIGSRVAPWPAASASKC
jgi:hypothetical protein